MNDDKRKSKKNKQKINSILLFAAFIASFLLTAIVSISSLTTMARDNTKEIDMMLTARVYDIINRSISEPITVSRAMSADRFLVDALHNEENISEEESVAIMQDYLSDFKERLGYDAAFVVSEKSGRYYTYKGLNKIIDPKNDAHDVWYSTFVERGEDYALDVDSDETSENQWTVFVNARVKDEEGDLIGVCGVGVRMTNLRELFKGLEEEYDVKINLIDKTGLVQVDTDEANIENMYLDADIIGKGGKDEYIYSNKDGDEFTVSKYVNYLDWYLVVQSDGGITSKEFMHVILFNVTLSLIVMGIVFCILSLIMRRLNRGSLIAESLNEQLSSMADIYRSAHDLDIINDTFTEIMTNNKNVSDILGDKHFNAQKTLFDIMDKLTDPISKNDIRRFVDFSTIDERMKNCKTITIEFLNIENLWLRGRFVVYTAYR